MDHDHPHDHHQDGGPPSFWRTRYGIGLLVLGTVAAYFLLTEHLAHVAGFLPFAFILACPLMHLFMHHGHGHDHHAHGTEGESAPPARDRMPPRVERSPAAADREQGDWQ
jgi:hypothetical protein